MEFRFSSEEEDLRKAVSEFVKKEMAEKELDREIRVPSEILRKMANVGFFSLRMPKQFGGEQGSWVDIGILVEELAKGSAVLALLTMLSYHTAFIMAAKSEGAMVEEWLPRIVQGTAVGSIALTEQKAGSDTAAIGTVAIPDGEEYVVTGEKCPVSFGMQADFTVLFAKTLDGAEGSRMTVFFLPLGLPGITRSPLTNTGLLASTPAHLTLKDVRIPFSYRIGIEGEGVDINKRYGLSSDSSCLFSALIALGMSEAALNSAILYSRKRHAFGRPIGQFQALSARIAEDATVIEAGRWLCYRGLSLKDQGMPNAREAAMCGWWCPSVAFQVIEDALLVHGHAGYSDDHPFQQMLRDVLAFKLIAGSEQLQKLAIAQDLIGMAAVPKEMRTVV